MVKALGLGAGLDASATGGRFINGLFQLHVVGDQRRCTIPILFFSLESSDRGRTTGIRSIRCRVWANQPYHLCYLWPIVVVSDGQLEYKMTHRLLHFGLIISSRCYSTQAAAQGGIKPDIPREGVSSFLLPSPLSF